MSGFQKCQLQVENDSSLDNLLEQHWRQTLSCGFLPRIRINPADSAIVFVSEMRDRSRMLLTIDRAQDRWQATLEVQDRLLALRNFDAD